MANLLYKLYCSPFQQVNLVVKPESRHPDRPLACWIGTAELLRTLKLMAEVPCDSRTIGILASSLRDEGRV